MGCFPCFESRRGEALHTGNVKDDTHEEHPMVPPHVDRVTSVASSMNLKGNSSTKREAKIEKNISSVNISTHTFTFRELAAATKNFIDEGFLGEGEFGLVYKGQLESTGQIVAVKQLDRNGLQGNREFLVEVLMLNLLHHQNLVNLIGYCADGDQRHLRSLFNGSKCWEFVNINFGHIL